jgi:hypothetical protein
MKSKSLYQRLLGLSERALRHNRAQEGVYAIGFESKKLIYGFDKNNLSSAIERLKNQGYHGEVMPFFQESKESILVYNVA